ncbi:HaaA family cyclophane-containing RiPP peptide [Streptomyces sp. NPDC002476]|uniref:HaaA family cyclophane-containing RiPP peptide n=1 Tax=Streptomyces sp. NPDC002476 TaxID=3364648 RepID=UPI0036AC6A7F
MPSRTPVPAPHATEPVTAEPVTAEPTHGSTVLDRVAARVRQRLAAEQTTPNRIGEGGHQASLSRFRPL